MGGQGVDPEGTTPQFFQSTKFFASLDVDEARELFGSTQRVHLQPHEVRLSCVLLSAAARGGACAARCARLW